jgi:hypothetical protein
MGVYNISKVLQVLPHFELACDVSMCSKHLGTSQLQRALGLRMYVEPDAYLQHNINGQT